MKKLLATVLLTAFMATSANASFLDELYSKFTSSESSTAFPQNTKDCRVISDTAV